MTKKDNNTSKVKIKTTPSQIRRRIRREKRVRKFNVMKKVITALLIIICSFTAIWIPFMLHQIHLPLSRDVKKYNTAIEKYSSKYGISEYTGLVKAVMMQESKGKGKDPMQSSEGTYNKKYPHEPGGIRDADYSIKCGVHQLADVLKLADCEGPDDLNNIMLALQGYNYGSGYIEWALENYESGYTKKNAEKFSEKMKELLGLEGYGDTQYAQHVLRYYSTDGK